MDGDGDGSGGSDDIPLIHWTGAVTMICVDTTLTISLQVHVIVHSFRLHAYVALAFIFSLHHFCWDGDQALALNNYVFINSLTRVERKIIVSVFEVGKEGGDTTEAGPAMEDEC